MKQPRWRRQLKSIIKSTSKYPTINYRQRHTRLIDNSDDYGQLKSTRNKVNYSRWKSKSDNDEVRRKSQSTINEGSRHSTKGIDNQRSTRIGKVQQSQIDLLTYCRQPQYQQSRWPTIYEVTIQNVRQLSAIKNNIPQKQRPQILSPKGSEKGEDVGRTLNPNCHRSFRQVSKIAATSDD